MLIILIQCLLCIYINHSSSFLLSLSFCFIFSGGHAPVVNNGDGSYRYDSKATSLRWSLPLIEPSSPTGSLEFTIPWMGDSANFFPLNLSFTSQKTFSKIEVFFLSHLFSVLCLFVGAAFRACLNSNHWNRCEELKNIFVMYKNMLVTHLWGSERFRNFKYCTYTNYLFKDTVVKLLKITVKIIIVIIKMETILILFGLHLFLGCKHCFSRNRGTNSVFPKHRSCNWALCCWIGMFCFCFCFS